MDESVLQLEDELLARVRAPYALLREGYARRDAALAASAYTVEAEARYHGATPNEVEVYRGTQEITNSFEQLFAQIAPDDTLDLNFRLVTRVLERGSVRERGVFRLRVGSTLSTFGHFDVLRADSEPERFAIDSSRPGTVRDFEEAEGVLLFAADQERLDGEYYDALTGRYRLPDGRLLIVTRSVVRLYALLADSGEWRGLRRVSGRQWVGGSRVIADDATATYRFAAPENGPSPSVEIEDGEGAREVASREPGYRVEPIRFSGRDGVTLAGEILVPSDEAARRPAAVMVHGSGPQDRHGYASIIRVLADALATAGCVVLSFDKRGVGESSGDWSRAGFAALGGDVAAAVEHLRNRPDVDPARVMLAGSSQAGWVSAAAVAAGTRPAAVFLLGAAGAALTVEEQNLYNTAVRMGCAGYTDDEIDLALAQQRAFFEFLRDPGAATRLDRLTSEGRARPRLQPWLFPASSEVNPADGAWFNTLEVDFDPLPIWRDYPGRLHLVFAEHDDSTPTDRALERLGSLAVERAGRWEIVVLDGAQHLGLEATGPCAAELEEVHRFHPGLFDALDDVMAAVRSESGES